MKRLLLIAVLLAGATHVVAQDWEMRLENGISLARLLPSAGSTPASGTVHYGFTKPALCLGPEVRLRMSEHGQFSLAYQYSSNAVGISIRGGSSALNGEHEYQKFDLHNLSVGYHYTTLIFHDRVQLGCYAKMGIAYGYMTEFGGGGSAGYGSDPLISSGSGTLTGFEVMPAFWTPTNTIGLIVGPHVKNPHIGDRLTFTVAAMICWKDPYISYAKMEYSMATNSYAQAGVVQYKGAPYMVQTGVNYRLFRFGKKGA